MASARAALAQPGTHWRIETAARAALLIDGAAYFCALADAMEEARHSIVILGWDLRSDLLLDPERSTETLAARLNRLIVARSIASHGWTMYFHLTRDDHPEFDAWLQDESRGAPVDVVAETFDRATPALEAILAMPTG